MHNPFYRSHEADHVCCHTLPSTSCATQKHLDFLQPRLSSLSQRRVGCRAIWTIANTSLQSNQNTRVAVPCDDLSGTKQQTTGVVVPSQLSHRQWLTAMFITSDSCTDSDCEIGTTPRRWATQRVRHCPDCFGNSLGSSTARWSRQLPFAVSCVATWSGSTSQCRRVAVVRKAWQNRRESRT
jgi:hypothetical protein